MVQNSKKTRINSLLINHCPTSEGVSKVSNCVSAAERLSERTNEQSAFSVILAHSALREPWEVDQLPDLLPRPLRGGKGGEEKEEG